ncbi:MAG: hypothetical protein IPK50_07290 [Fibrobacterota bacterium]|nr:MAG: hypothetical protein IPK50_07290 [Fibrobacterota bacterium]
MHSITRVGLALSLALSTIALAAKAPEGQVVVTASSFSALPPDDRAPAKAMFLQTLGELRQGAYLDLSDSGCSAIPCAQGLMAKTQSKKALWMSLLKLGSTYSLSASVVGPADSTAVVRRASFQVVDDLPRIMDQVMRSAFDNTTLADAGTVDNVAETESEKEMLRRKSSSMSGVTVGALYPIGSSYERSITEPRTYRTGMTTFDTTRYRQPRQNLTIGYSYWYEFRQNLTLDVELKGNIPSSLAFQLDVVNFFTRSDISPFVGGGLGMEYVFPDKPDPDDKINVGPQLNLQGGLMLFRTYDVRALVRGGYQITANSDHDQGAYAEVGLLYAPSTKKSGNQEAGVWRWILGGLVGLVVIGLAAD